MTYYLQENANASGAYAAPQDRPGPGTIPISEEQRDMVVQYNGFVTVKKKTDKAGAVSYDITPNTEAWEEWKATIQPDQEKSNYIPTAEQSAVVMMRAAFAQQVKDMENDMVLQCSGLAEPWVPGDHKSGEVYNVGDQTWECFADYDNSTYPDVKPGDPSWFTFNRPLHGKSIETARPWVKPENGTTDIYHSGEYMVFTDGYTYKAKRDTNFSPEEYPADWEKVD